MPQHTRVGEDALVSICYADIPSNMLQSE